MPIASATDKQLRALYNKTNNSAVLAIINALVTAVNAGAQVVNSLSADAAGRAMMATGYFTEAAATSKFVAGAITTALLKAGIISADATGRALFAAGALDLATVASAFAVNSIDESKLARRIAAQALSGAGAITLTETTTLFTSTGASQALTLDDGTFDAQRKRIIHIADGGSGVITQTTGAKLTTGITTITFTAAWDWVELEWKTNKWNPVAISSSTLIA